VRRLRDRFAGVRIERFDISASPAELPDRAFDAVSAFDVLFHLLDDAAYRRAVSNLARLVRPGGVLAISENFRRHGPRRFAAVQVNREEGEILTAFRGSGFELLDRHPMFMLMNAPACGGGPLLHAWWRWAHSQITTRPRAGRILGAALYPLELVCLTAVRRAPSTELAIFRRF
jgi:SAM-dependent methyltransferase